MSEKIMLTILSMVFILILALLLFCAAARVGKVDFETLEHITETAGEVAIPEAIKEHNLVITLYYTLKNGPMSERYHFRNVMEASYFAEAVRRRMEQ